MKLSELSAGALVIADDGFTCLKSGAYTVQADSAGRLFIPCGDGQHYLDGQVSFSDPETLVGLTEAALVPHDKDAYRYLADEPPAVFPEGYSAPLDDRSTHEIMADRDAQIEGKPVWQLIDNSNNRNIGYFRILKDGKRVADVFPYGKESDEPFVKEQAARIVEQMNKIDMIKSES